MRQRSTLLGAALLLTGYLVVGMAPIAIAAPASCNLSSGTLTVSLNGNSASFAVDTPTTSGGKVTVTALGCSATPFDDVASLGIYGGGKSEVITFVDAGNSLWAPVTKSMDLGSGKPDRVVLQGTAASDTIDASTFASGYSDAELVEIYGYGDTGDCSTPNGDNLTGATYNFNLIDGGTGCDGMSGGDMDDQLIGGDGDDDISGGSGDDLILGGAGDDVLDGESGDDVVTGGDGDDLLFGGVDDDLMDGGLGDDIIRGDDGNDTVDYGSRTTGLTVVLPEDSASSDNGESGEDDTLRMMENVIAGSGDDDLTGDKYDNVIDPGTGDDVIDGAAGEDLIYYGRRTASVTVDIDAGTGGESGESDTFSGIEDARTGSGDDFLYGDAGSNVLEGGAGADLIEGFEDADYLNGGADSDTFVEGSDDASDDSIRGDAGKDLVDYSARTSAVVIDLRNGDGEDTFYADVENVLGGSGDDTITGTELANSISGNDGGDTIDARGGNDTLVGGLGLDHLYGGDGDDRLDGTKDGAVDVLYGGAQAKGDTCNIEGTSERDASNSCETYIGTKKVRA